MVLVFQNYLRFFSRMVSYRDGRFYTATVLEFGGFRKYFEIFTAGWLSIIETVLALGTSETFKSFHG